MLDFLQLNIKAFATILICGSIGYLCGHIGGGVAIGLIVVGLGTFARNK